MNAAIVIQLLLGLLDRASAISALIQTAQNEGRDITDAEMDAVVAADDAAKKSLQDTIDAAR